MWKVEEFQPQPHMTLGGGVDGGSQMWIFSLTYKYIYICFNIFLPSVLYSNIGNSWVFCFKPGQHKRTERFPPSHS